MKNTITTVKIRKETKARLEKLKEYQRETFDELIKKILGILNLVKTDCNKAVDILNKIDENRLRQQQQKK